MFREAAVVVSLSLSLSLGLAGPLSAGPVGGGAGASADPPSKARSTESRRRAADERVRAVETQVPDATALLVDAYGVPLYRIDVFLGPDSPLSGSKLEKFVSSFRLEDGLSEVVDTVFMAQPDVPEGEAAFVYVAPDTGLAAAFRRLPSPILTAMSCAAHISFSLNNSYPKHGSYFVYAKADFVKAAVGPNKNKKTDPDLYIDSWTGGSWQLMGSSTHAKSLDAVGVHSPSCTSFDVRVEVFMAKGGKHSLVIFRSNASP